MNLKIATLPSSWKVSKTVTPAKAGVQTCFNFLDSGFRRNDTTQRLTASHGVINFERPMKEKECFGILQRVFPMGAEGLREVPPGCFECSGRMACLRAALSTPEGIRLRIEMVDRASSKGMMGRLEQWSKKKELSRLVRKAGKKSK